MLQESVTKVRASDIELKIEANLGATCVLTKLGGPIGISRVVRFANFSKLTARTVQTTGALPNYSY